MVTIRKAHDRGHADHGWLDTHHTFSFADYQDPEHMGFRSLRVINDDIVAPARGFGAHPHRDMEIVTYVLEGALQHKDSLGTGSVIRPGELQRMTAGRGIVHSEFNASKEEPVHLLQIWILPEARGLEPGYEQKTFPPEERKGKLRLMAARDGRSGALTIHQDAEIWGAILAPGDRVEHVLKPGRHAWIHVATGAVKLNGERLEAGDGVAVSDEKKVVIEGEEAGEVLVFDLA